MIKLRDHSGKERNYADWLRLKQWPQISHCQLHKPVISNSGFETHGVVLIIPRGII